MGLSMTQPDAPQPTADNASPGPGDASTQSAADTRVPWRTPHVLSSEVFTRAALSCCGIYDGPDQVGAEGSQGANLPEC
jgi:hypothetical protein